MKKRKRIFVITLVCLLMFTLGVPATVLAGGSGDYTAQIKVTADTEKTYDSRTTLLVEFQVKTENDAKLANLQSVALAYNTGKFNLVRTDSTGIFEAALSKSFQSIGKDYSSTLSGWDNRLYAAKNDDEGYLLIQTSRSVELGFSGLECPEFVTLESIRLTLKPGIKLTDISSSDIRLINRSERELLNQSGSAWVCDGSNQFTYGEDPDTLAAPAVIASGFTFSKDGGQEPSAGEGTVTPEPGQGATVITKEVRKQDTIIMQIDNYAAAIDGGLCHIYPGEKNVVPYIDENDRTMVPVRFVAESLNAVVDWESDTKTVVITLDGNVVRMVIGSNQFTLNWEAKSMDTAAVIKSSRTMVPVRFVAEALGKAVEWDNANRLVVVTEPEVPWVLDRSAEKEVTSDVLLVISPLVRDFIQAEVTEE